MGKRGVDQPKAKGGVDHTSLRQFADAVQKQMQDPKRKVRVFDVGGSGVKTALFAASSLRQFLGTQPCPLDPTEALPEDPAQMEWIDPPHTLGAAPGQEGFAEWLMQTLPALRTEVQDAKVVFGVSVAGGVEHSTGILHDWWCGGGHPQQWGRERPSPTVASLMGLPQCRTFVLNDGTAHLVGCGRGVVPLGQVACFAIGTGVGFGLSDGEGAVVDPATPNGARSHLLRGAAVPNDVYGGVWRQWPGLASAAAKGVRARDFAGEGKPWSTPWTSLVLGARGMELAEAAFQCASPPTGASAEASTGAERAPAVEAFGQQWLHFLHTLFLPQFRNRLHGVRYLCFCGGVVDTNWPLLQQTLLQPGTALLQPLPPEVADGGSILAGGPNSKKARGSKRREARERTVDGLGAVTVLPPGPHGSGLIGAGIYALGGVGGAAQGMWAA